MVWPGCGAPENRGPEQKYLGEDFRSKIPGPYLEVDPIFGTGLDNLIKASYDLLNLITFTLVIAPEQSPPVVIV